MSRTAFTIIAVITAFLCSPELHGQWIQQKSGTGTTLSDVVMIDSTTAIVVARNGSILRTTDFGATWIDVAAPLSYIQPWTAVSFFNATYGTVAGDHGVVMTSSNGGRNWVWHQLPGAHKCLSVLYSAPGMITVGTDSGWVYTSRDTGRSWTGENISKFDIRSLFTYRGPGVFGVLKYALTPYTLCVQSDLGPYQWNETLVPGFAGLGSEAYAGEFCNGGGAGFLVGVQGDLRAAPAIVRKSMSDSVWRFVAGGLRRDGTFFGVAAPSASVIYVCGSGGMIFRSPNGGDTWTDQTRETRLNLNAVSFYDEQRGIAVGDSGLILVTKNGGVTTVKGSRNDLPGGYALEQNFPDPFNPSTTFSFTIPVRSFVTLTIADMLGREVATIVAGSLPPGTYSHRWDPVGLPSGAYFYRLQAGDYSETKRLLFLK